MFTFFRSPARAADAARLDDAEPLFKGMVEHHRLVTGKEWPVSTRCFPSARKAGGVRTPRSYRIMEIVLLITGMGSAVREPAVADPGDIPGSGVTAVVRQLLCAPETSSGSPTTILGACWCGNTSDPPGS
jgi:hypothetical protein